jgi:2-iminobutanoate/2-iminopropanoate deaminase
MKKLSLYLIIPFFALAVTACISGEEAEEEIRLNAFEKEVIYLSDADKGKPFSPAVRSGNTLYVSGTIGTDPETGALGADIREQTRLSLQRISNVLEAAGYSMEDVVRCTVMMSDISYYTPVNEVYTQFFPSDPPARKAFAVKDLPLGALVEIEATAVR